MKKQLTPPKIVLPKSAQLPDIEIVTLANGLPVHLIRTAGQQVARISLVWGAGSSVQTKPFSASATLNLLAEGSERLSAHEIAERLDFVGSYFDVSIDRDYAVATFCCLEKFFAPTLEMLSEIVLRPFFPEDEVEIYRRKRMERLAVERAKPAVKARELFSQALFGESHPYGISSPEGEYLNLQRSDIQEFYTANYCAENCFVVASLGTDDGQRDALLELLAQIPRNPLSTFNSQFSTPETTPKRMLEIPGAVQSAIRIGRILFPRQHPDFVGMQVVATILGGYFGSRLTQNLREKRGYTYGVMAAMVNLRESGYLAIATEVGAEATEDAIAQIFSELERLKTELVTEDELDTVRRSMLGEVMRILDGPFGIVDIVIENIQISGCKKCDFSEGDGAKNGAKQGVGTGFGEDQDIDAGAKNASPEGLAAGSGTEHGNDSGADSGTIGHINYLNDFIRQVESITPERIRELARKHLDPEAFTTVVVGGTRKANAT